jgi:TPR repeat protein
MAPAFSFPDHVFPPISNPFTELPLAPLEKIRKIESGYHRLVRQVSGGPDIEAEKSSKQYGSNLQRRLSQNIQLSHSNTSGFNTKIDVNVLFKWARETVDFAENQPGLSPEIVDAAVDIIVLVSEASKGLTKFKGAAQYIVALWHFFGLFNRNIDPQKALDLFYASAKSGFARALYRIGSEFEKAGDMANALSFYNQGVLKNDSACLYRMAMCHLRGHLGIEIDYEQGMQHLYSASKISDPDCPQASYILGLIQLGELLQVAPPDLSLPEDAGIAAMERAAWLGFSPALFRMGMAWQGGEKGYDSSIALRYFHVASRHEQYQIYKKVENAGQGGVSEVEISKWLLCGSEGIFLPNEEYAFYFAKLASDLGNGTAQFAVGYFYEVGIFVKQDIQAALIWYGLAASNDSTDATCRLKELNINRQNTITKKQHKRALTLKGRGSMKHFRRKQSQNTIKPETEYPDVLRCTSVNPDSRPVSTVGELPRQQQFCNPHANYGNRAVSENLASTRGTPKPSNEPQRRSRKARYSLPAGEYQSTPTPAQHSQSQQRKQHCPQEISAPNGRSETHPAAAVRRGVSTALPTNHSHNHANVVGNRRISSPVFPSTRSNLNSSKASTIVNNAEGENASTNPTVSYFPGSQLLSSLSGFSLATKKPEAAVSNVTAQGRSPSPTKSYGSLPLRNSPAPNLSSDIEVKPAPLPDAKESNKLRSSTNVVASTSKFGVLGSFFGYGNGNTSTSGDEPKVDDAILQPPPASTTPSQRSFSMPPESISSVSQPSSSPLGPRSVPSPSSTVPKFTRSPATSKTALSSSSLAPSREGSISPNKNPQFQQRSFSSYNLPPPSSTLSDASRYSPSNLSDMSSYSNSTSTSLSSVSSTGTPIGSDSPSRKPNSNVQVIPAGPSTGRGAKTFEEMGIPLSSKQKGDCTIM